MARSVNSVWLTQPAARPTSPCQSAVPALLGVDHRRGVAQHRHEPRRRRRASLGARAPERQEPRQPRVLDDQRVGASANCSASQLAQLARAPSRRARLGGQRPGARAARRRPARARSRSSRVWKSTTHCDSAKPRGLVSSAGTSGCGDGVAEALEDAGEQARAAAAGAGDEHERARAVVRRPEAGGAEGIRRVAAPAPNRDGHEMFARARARGAGAATTARADARPPFARHVLERTVVLPRAARAVPPDAEGRHARRCCGCWRSWPGSRRRFEHSPLPEVSPALTVHDMSLWPDEHRLPTTTTSERERMLGAGGLAALLARARPGDRACGRAGSRSCCCASRASSRSSATSRGSRACPSGPASSSRTSARSSPRSAAGKVEDVHWAVQHDLVAQLPLDHVGRVERMDETLALLRRARRRARWPGGAGTRTAAPCRCRRAPTTRAAAARARALRAPTSRASATRRRARPPSRSPTGRQRVDAAAAAAARDDRRARPRRAAAPSSPSARAAGVRSAEERLSAPRRGRRPRALAGADQPRGPHGLQRPLGLGRRRRRARLHAVVRVKDEARSLPWVLPPLLRAVRARGADRQRLDRRHAGGRAAVARECGRGGPPRGPRLPVRGRALRRASTSPRRPSRCTAWRTSTTGRSPTSAPPTRSSGTATWCSPTPPSTRCATSPGSSRPPSAVVQGAALPAVRGRRPARVPRHRAAQLRAVGAGRTGPGYSFVKAMEWELPLWAAEVADDHAARLRLRRAQAPGRRRVRPLVAHRLRRARARTRAQAARVGGVRGAGRGRDAARRASWRSTRRRAARDRARRARAGCRSGLAAAVRACAVAQAREPRARARARSGAARRRPARLCSSSGSRSQVVELALAA